MNKYFQKIFTNKTYKIKKNNIVNLYKQYEYNAKKGVVLMKKEYIVTSSVIENTEEEKEEIYEKLANIFISMAQNELKKNDSLFNWIGYSKRTS